MFVSIIPVPFWNLSQSHVHFFGNLYFLFKIPGRVFVEETNHLLCLVWFEPIPLSFDFILGVEFVKLLHSFYHFSALLWKRILLWWGKYFCKCSRTVVLIWLFILHFVAIFVGRNWHFCDSLFFLFLGSFQQRLSDYAQSVLLDTLAWWFIDLTWILWLRELWKLLVVPLFRAVSCFKFLWMSINYRILLTLRL